VFFGAVAIVDVVLGFRGEHPGWGVAAQDVDTSQKHWMNSDTSFSLSAHTHELDDVLDLNSVRSQCPPGFEQVLERQISIE
jgi:hypothetical protein